MTQQDILAEILATNTYLTVSTASLAGVPRGTPVHFAHDETYVYWLSKPGSVHSQNIVENNRVFVTVFDDNQSNATPAQRRAAYIETRAEALSGDDELAAREVYADKFGDEDGRRIIDWKYYRAAIGTIDESRSDAQRIYCNGGV